MKITESILEDVRLWVEEGRLIAQFLEQQGDIQDAKDWNEMIDLHLEAFKLWLCESCGCCYRRWRLKWDELDAHCPECAERIRDQEYDYEQTAREAYEDFKKKQI